MGVGVLYHYTEFRRRSWSQQKHRSNMLFQRLSVVVSSSPTTYYFTVPRFWRGSVAVQRFCLSLCNVAFFCRDDGTVLSFFLALANVNDFFYSTNVLLEHNTDRNVSLCKHRSPWQPTTTRERLTFCPECPGGDRRMFWNCMNVW